MPRIQGYEQQYVASGQIPTRQANAEDFGGPGLQQLGHGIQATGQDVGYAVRQLQFAESQRQVTDAHIAIQEIRRQFTEKLLDEESKVDPSDTEFSKRFLFGKSGEGDEGSLKWTLDKTGEQYTDPLAKAEFQRHAATLTADMGISLARAQSNMARTYAKQQAIQLVDKGQQVIEKDPLQYDDRLRETLAHIDDPNGIFYGRGVDQSHREEYKRIVKEQYAESAVKGWIRIDAPSAKQSLLEGHEWKGLTGEKFDQLMRMADIRIHALDVEARQKEAAAQREQKKLQDTTASNLLSRWIDQVGVDGSTAPTELRETMATEVSDLLDKNHLRYSQARSLMNVFKAHASGKTLKSGSTEVFWDFMKRASLPWGDDNKLTDMDEVLEAGSRGEITMVDLKNIQKVVMDSRTQAGQSIAQDRTSYLNSVKNRITKTNRFTGITDGLGDGKFRDFTTFALQQEEAARKANRDPHEVYEPKSQYFIGNYLDKYVPTLAETTEYMKAEMRRAKTSMDAQRALEKGKPAPPSGMAPAPAAPQPPSSTRPPRLEGETWEQYKKRNGIK